MSDEEGRITPEDMAKAATEALKSPFDPEVREERFVGGVSVGEVADRAIDRERAQLERLTAALGNGGRDAVLDFMAFVTGALSSTANDGDSEALSVALSYLDAVASGKDDRGEDYRRAYVAGFASAVATMMTRVLTMTAVLTASVHNAGPAHVLAAQEVMLRAIEDGPLKDAIDRIAAGIWRDQATLVTSAMPDAEF